MTTAHYHERKAEAEALALAYASAKAAAKAAAEAQEEAGVHNNSDNNKRTNSNNNNNTNYTKPGEEQEGDKLDCNNMCSQCEDDLDYERLSTDPAFWEHLAECEVRNIAEQDAVEEQAKSLLDDLDREAREEAPLCSIPRGVMCKACVRLGCSAQCSC